MNTLAEVWERKKPEHIISSTIKNISKPIVLTAFAWLSACASTQTNIETQWTDSLATHDISESIRLNMIEPYKSQVDSLFDINILESIDIPELRWKYSFDLSAPESITEINLPDFEKDMEIFRATISKLLDFNIPYGCTDVFKWRREIEVRLGYNCDDVQRPTYSGNIWTHNSKRVDGILIHTPRPECKMYKYLKWRDDKLIGNLNRGAVVRFSDDIDDQAFEEAYHNSCKTERSIWRLIWWRRG